jgi:OOP family OmpA-OmpF porin
VLQDALETIHLQFGAQLEAFAGDTSTFEGSRPALEACLQMQYRKGERQPSPRGARLLAVLAVIALVVWLGLTYRTSQRRARYVEALRAEPGLVVLSTTTSGGRLVVNGLRDPLARDPGSLLGAGDLSPTDVVGHWAPYQALDPPLVLARARALLSPPAGVTLQLSADGVLSAAGNPTVDWVAETGRRVPYLAGVRVFDAAGALEPAVKTAVAAIDGATIHFVRGSTEPVAGEDEAMSRLVIHMRELETLAAAAGLRFQVAITGHTDADGPDVSNLPLSRARAELVRTAIAPQPLARVTVMTIGEGSRQPAVASGDEAGKQMNRRVSLRVSRLTEERLKGNRR